MKQLKKYKLFVESIKEGYEEIMTNMEADDVDISGYEKIETEMTTLKNNIENKKKELEQGLNNLEKLEVDTFTEENKEIMEKKKSEIKDKIKKIKDEISSFEDNINTLKDKITSIKK